MIRKFTILLFLCFLICGGTYGQGNGYHIKGMINGYDQDTIFLGYYYADKQYLLDTSSVLDGSFEFSGTDTLRSGVYMIVMPPDNKYFQLMVHQEQSLFSFQADMADIEGTITFEKSPDNDLFYDHLKFIASKRALVEDLNSKKETATGKDLEKVEQELQRINAQVLEHQQKIIEDNPNSMTALLIRSGFQIDLPEFEGTEKEKNLKNYLYYKKHYFDNVDLSDPRMIRTPAHVLDSKITYYIDKLTPKDPDSIIVSIDYLLEEMKGAEETYKYYLVEFLNEYAQSKIVGMDAVYVHLALNYYARGEAPWVEETQLKKIIANARDASPTLIGQTAPDFKVQLRDSTDIQLYDVDADYTILIFWSHTCNHCKESMPKLKEFYEKETDLNIEVFSVCTKMLDEEPACWDFIDGNNLDGWINTSDKSGGRSNMHKLFNIKKTPKLFILDRNKKIVSKDLGPEQLDEFFDHIVEAPND